MIIPVTGGVMLKATGTMRAYMPQMALTTRWHYDLQMYSGPFDLGTLEATYRMLRRPKVVPCAVCAGVADLGFGQEPITTQQKTIIQKQLGIRQRLNTPMSLGIQRRAQRARDRARRDFCMQMLPRAVPRGLRMRKVLRAVWFADGRVRLVTAWGGF